MPKPKGKKGKGKKVEMATDPVSLKPFGVCVNDIIQTPLGVEATVVGLDVGAGVLHLKWPGDIQSPMPSKCRSKADMEAFGYVRKGQWGHIQRSLDDRANMVFQHKFYGGLMPKTAALKLPQPGGVQLEWSNGEGRPKTAPVG